MRALVLPAAIGITLTVVVVGPRVLRAPPPPAAARISVTEALSASAIGFARATAPRAFRFPADHGPHPEFRSEWWYYTGNLADASGRRFGYQLTFFRVGLAPDAATRSSAWATTATWMAHFAVTDVATGRFLTASRFSREALGLAGGAAAPFLIWLEDWSARGTTSDGEHPRMRLVAADGDTAIDLTLRTTKPPVLQGERGLSRKSAAPGNASYYYSLTRLDTHGHVRVGGARADVSGTSWMDREWSTSALDPGQSGWDWFALTLDDGRELTFYRLRRADGSVDPFSAGALVARDGAATPLGPGDVTIEVTSHWTSARDGTRYPSRWRLTLPAHALTLEIAPRVADQEWIEPVRYWEGAVDVRGAVTDAGRGAVTGAGRGAVTGAGYVELVGYAR